MYLVQIVIDFVNSKINYLPLVICRILLEKRQAQDAMELLKLYHQSVANGTEDVSPPKQERV